MQLSQRGTNGLSDPDKPSTSWPSFRWDVDPAARHAAKYPRLPDRGAARGVHFNRVAKGEQGRLTTHYPKPRLLHDPTGVSPINLSEFPMLGDLYARTKDLKDRQRRRKAIRFEKTAKVNLGNGPTGLQFAQSIRVVPDTPSGRRSAIRDRMNPRERGDMAANRIAPASVLREFARSRSYGFDPTTDTPTSPE